MAEKKMSVSEEINELMNELSKKELVRVIEVYDWYIQTEKVVPFLHFYKEVFVKEYL